MSGIEERLKMIQQQAAQQIRSAEDIDRLNEIRVAVLGKKGSLTAVMKSMKDVAPEDRPKVGKWVNDARAGIEGILEEHKAAFLELAK